MTNMLTEKVKEIQKQFFIKWEQCNCEDGFHIGLCEGRPTSGHSNADGHVWTFIKASIIALLEADVERLSKGTDYLFKKGLYERSHEISLEVTYKQQAIDELKKLTV